MAMVFFFLGGINVVANEKGEGSHFFPDEALKVEKRPYIVKRVRKYVSRLITQ